MLRVNHEDLSPTDDFLIYIYKGIPFTGIAYENDENGNKISEVSYLNGQRDGITKEWFPNGQVFREEYYRYNALHGQSRQWYKNGTLNIEAVYEIGVCLQRKVWAEDGKEVEVYRIDESSPQFATLERLRESTIGKLVKGQKE